MAHRHDGSSLHILYLALPSGWTVGYLCILRQIVTTRCPALGSPSRWIVLVYSVPRLAVTTDCQLSLCFETNRCDVMSCSRLTVMMDHYCVYCILPRRQDGRSVIYCASRQLFLTD